MSSFGSEGQAKPAGRILDLSPLPSPCQWLLQRTQPRQCTVFQVSEQSTVLQVCTVLQCSVCIPLCLQQEVPYEISASPGTAPLWMWHVWFSWIGTHPASQLPCIRNFKCTLSSMISFLFHRATVIYEAYFHVVTRKRCHLMLGQCTFLSQTYLKTFYCF